MRTRHRIDRTVAAMAHRIARGFRPEKVILFGSRATGKAGADSDVDLLVVMPLTASKATHELEIRAALRGYRTPKDVIVTTPRSVRVASGRPGHDRACGCAQRARAPMRNADRAAEVAAEWMARAANDLLTAARS